MTQYSLSTMAQSLGASTGGGDSQPDDASLWLRLSAGNLVRRALARADFGPQNRSRGEDTATGNRSGSAGNHTWDSGAAQVVNLPLSPVPAPRRSTLHALQEWEGHVVSVGDNAFVARLVDVTAGMEYESEEASIPLQELSDHDAARLEVGDIFRWVIGYERSPEGTRKRVSQIVFRDLPRMTEGDLHAGRAWARRVVSALNP